MNEHFYFKLSFTMTRYEKDYKKIRRQKKCIPSISHYLFSNQISKTYKIIRFQGTYSFQLLFTVCFMWVIFPTG